MSKYRAKIGKAGSISKLIFIIMVCILLFCMISCEKTLSMVDYSRDSFSGTIFLLGEESEFQIDMYSNGIQELRMTETSVQREDEIIHRDDIATINENKITMLKEGKYKLWAITEDVRYLSHYNVWGIDINELKSEKRTNSEFETTLYFQEKINQGEDMPFAVFNKNISETTLFKTTPHLDPYKGAPGISIFTLIEGHKLYVGKIGGYIDAIGTYTHEPEQVSRLLQSYAPIIGRYNIISLADGKNLKENDPFLKTFGFESNLFLANHEENNRMREELWADLKTRYNLEDPEYNREWFEIYHAYPIYDPLYSNILAPKGFYHIELSNGELIENAFEIV